MTCRELNNKLIEIFPEIKENYHEETSWQDGDDTGSHIVFENVFIPFVREQMRSNNKQVLAKIFDFIEELLKLNDQYTDEVVAFSVLEALLLGEKAVNTSFLPYAKENTLQVIKEILESFEL